MACAFRDRVSKALDHVHGQATAVDGYQVKRHIVSVAFGGDRRRGGLAEIFAVGTVTDNRCESVAREIGHISWVDLRSDSTGFAEAINGHRVISDSVQRDLQIADVVVFGLGELPGPQVDLQGWQDELGHAELAVAAFAHFHERIA